MVTLTCLSRQNCVGRKTQRARTKSCKALVAASARRLTQSPLHCQQLQPKANIEFAAVVCATTGQACDCAFDFAYAREIAPAIRATVDETLRITLPREWQRMAALFACDSQIATSLLPLGPVR